MSLTASICCTDVHLRCIYVLAKVKVKMKFEAILLLLTVSLHSTYAVLPYEPVQYLTAHLPSPLSSLSSSFGDFLTEASAQEAGNWVSRAKQDLKSHLADSSTSVLLLRGEQMLLRHRAKGFELNTTIEVPSANLLPIVSIVLPILLEGYDEQVLQNSISKDSSATFLDVLSKLPGPYDKKETLQDLSENGIASLQFINSLLDKEAKEAWKDAYMALGVSSNVPEGDKRMVMTAEDLIQISLTMTHDSIAMGSAEDNEIPLDDDKYLFGWWFNCAKDSSSHCLIPNAPKDTIFSLSPDLRLYVTPSLELTLIVLGPGVVDKEQNLESVADILKEDRKIWKILDPSTVDGSSERAPLN